MMLLEQFHYLVLVAKSQNKTVQIRDGRISTDLMKTTNVQTVYF